MELELKASIPSKILDLQVTLIFSSYGNEKMFAGLCQSLPLTFICFPVFSLSQTDLTLKEICCKPSSYGAKNSSANSPSLQVLHVASGCKGSVLCKCRPSMTFCNCNLSNKSYDLLNVPPVKALCCVTFEISHLMFITTVHNSIYHDHFIDEETGAHSKLNHLPK